MNSLIHDIEALKAALAEGRDVAELKFESAEFSGLARDLAKRYSRLDTQAKRRIRTASASLNRAKIEKEQYKSSLSELQKILDLCRVISSSLDLKDILHHLLFLLSEILPSRGCAVFVGGSRTGTAEAAFGNSPLALQQFHPATAADPGPAFRRGHHPVDPERAARLPHSQLRGPAGDGGVNGDFAVIPLNDNDSNYGFIWIACTIKQEEVTPETTNLIWVLSSHASIAIMNCLHRQRMEEKLNELKLLTSINALKGEILRQGVSREEGRAAEGAFGSGGSLTSFYREFRFLIARELKLDGGHLILGSAGRRPGHAASPAVHGRHPVSGASGIAQAAPLGGQGTGPAGSRGFFPVRLSPCGQGPGLIGPGPAFPFRHGGPGAGSLGAYLLLPLTADDMQRIPMLQNLLLAMASQARVVAENIELYDSLLAANRNLTALQWQLVHSGKMAALGQLAGGVAHEINNPLQIMLGRIQMIQMMAEDKKPAGGGKLKDELNLVTEEVLRIRDIVRNLLDFSRQGKRETSFSPMSMNDTLKDVLALLHHQLISNQVDVRLALEPENTRGAGQPQPA